MNTNTTALLTESVEGFLSQNGKNLFEGEVLFHLARRLPSHSTAVEIGSWKGKSTIWLGKGIESSHQQETALYAIDPHIGSAEHKQNGEKIWTFTEFESNIAKAELQSIVKPLVMSSVEGAKQIDKEIDFVFIDGAHDYESVKLDFETWFPKVKVGGTMAFHDSFIGWPGVQKVVDKELFLSNSFKHVRYINSITYAIKVDKLSFFEKVQNRFAYSIKYLHIWSLKFPQPFKSFVKKLTWRPCQTAWMRDLSKIDTYSE